MNIEVKQILGQNLTTEFTSSNYLVLCLITSKTRNAMQIQVANDYELIKGCILQANRLIIPVYIVHTPRNMTEISLSRHKYLPSPAGIKKCTIPHFLSSMLLKQTEAINHHMIGIATKSQRPLKTTCESEICVGSSFRTTTQFCDERKSTKQLYL